MERARDARRRPDDVGHDEDDNQVPTRDAAREAKRDALVIEIAAAPWSKIMRSVRGKSCIVLSISGRLSNTSDVQSGGILRFVSNFR